MAAIVRELGELLSVGPRDFHSNDSSELGDSRFTSRIFGGASTGALGPETLQFHFASLVEGDCPKVCEIVRRSMNILSRDLGCCERDHVTLNTSKHVSAANQAAVETYPAQFAWGELADMAAANGQIGSQPAAKIILSDRRGRWSLIRMVERSTIPADGVYVTTMQIRSRQLTPVEDQRQWWLRIRSLGDQAMGLTYPGENP